MHLKRFYIKWLDKLRNQIVHYSKLLPESPNASLGPNVSSPSSPSSPGPSSESRFADGWKNEVIDVWWCDFRSWRTDIWRSRLWRSLCTAIAVSSSTSHIRLNILASYCCWTYNLSNPKASRASFPQTNRGTSDSPGCWTFGSSEIIEGSIEKTGQLMKFNCQMGVSYTLSKE